MAEAVLSALGNIVTFQVMGYLLLGVSIGIVIGVLPGLGGLVGATILIPFLYGMEPTAGIAMLIGMASVTQTSDTFPAVLIGVPGSASAQATVLDGFPLAKRGQANRALGASFSASMLGGIIGAVALLVVISVARPLVGFLTTPDLFMLTVFGLATVGVLVRGDPLLGIASAVLGLMLGTIGGAPATPEYRYVFGEVYLYGGLSVVGVAMGLFAVPEVLHLLVQRTPIARTESEPGGLLRGFRETLRHKGLVVRSSLLGIGVGAIPGIGGSIVDWITYGIAKQTARDNSEFGKGDIRGVIAPESANNAREGGSLIPTLVVGIPGSPMNALLLGGLILMGINPGPAMVDRHLDLTLTIVWTLAIANVVATTVCLTLSRYIARITDIPGQLLAPFLMLVFLLAGYQASRNVRDLIVILLIGVLGYVMKLASWPRAPAIIGFVLATNLERFLHISISRYGYGWMTDRSVLIIFMMICAMLFAGPLLRYRRSRRRERTHVSS